MRPRFAAAVAAGLTAVLVAGCAGMGGGNESAPPPALSHADFVRAADRACERNRRAEKAIPNPTDLASLIHGLQRAVPVLEHEIVTLRSLHPPSRDAAAFGRVLKDLDAQDLAGTQLIDSLSAHQVRRSKALGRRLDTLGKQLRRLDRRLGLRACVKAV